MMLFLYSIGTGRCDKFEMGREAAYCLAFSRYYVFRVVTMIHPIQYHFPSIS